MRRGNPLMRYAHQAQARNLHHRGGKGNARLEARVPVLHLPGEPGGIDTALPGEDGEAQPHGPGGGRVAPHGQQIGGGTSAGDGPSVERTDGSAHHHVGLKAPRQHVPGARLIGAEHSARRKHQRSGHGASPLIDVDRMRRRLAFAPVVVEVGDAGEFGERVLRRSTGGRWQVRGSCAKMASDASQRISGVRHWERSAIFQLMDAWVSMMVRGHSVLPAMLSRWCSAASADGHARHAEFGDHVRRPCPAMARACSRGHMLRTWPHCCFTMCGRA